MRTVRWSAKALDQFDAAVAYLTRHNEEAADRLADRLSETVAALARRPIGRPGYCDGTYEKAVLGTSYVIVYALFGGSDGELWVYRVVHTAQNWTDWTPGPDEAF